MSEAKFWLIGGPNGAGKSTLAKSPAFSNLLVPKPLNPDDVTRVLLLDRGYTSYQEAPYDVQMECSLKSANWIYAEVARILNEGGEVCVETVLSTEKYLPLFRQVAEAGGDANLIYVGNIDPSISIKRVGIRVRKGGHGVPIEKIRARWYRSLALLPTFYKIATQAWIFDHSYSAPKLLVHKNPHQKFVEIVDTQLLEKYAGPLRESVKECISHTLKNPYVEGTFYGEG